MANVVDQWMADNGMTLEIVTNMGSMNRRRPNTDRGGFGAACRINKNRTISNLMKTMKNFNSWSICSIRPSGTNINKWKKLKIVVDGKDQTVYIGSHPESNPISVNNEVSLIYVSYYILRHYSH